jgi:hypothetical protein
MSIIHCRFAKNEHGTNVTVNQKLTENIEPFPNNLRKFYTKRRFRGKAVNVYLSVK